jgi:hypothetical protein
MIGFIVRPVIPRGIASRTSGGGIGVPLKLKKSHNLTYLTKVFNAFKLRPDLFNKFLKLPSKIITNQGKQSKLVTVD